MHANKMVHQPGHDTCGDSAMAMVDLPVFHFAQEVNDSRGIIRNLLVVGPGVDLEDADQTRSLLPSIGHGLE